MKIVVVGGGQAGGWAAKTAATVDRRHEIVLIGEEVHPPYERPPLSKEVLLGDMPPTDVYMWRDAPGFEVRSGIRAIRLDRAEKQILLSNGEVVDYDRLILATGGRVRQINRPGVHYLRTIADSLAISKAMTSARSLLVIGGGWIGLEVAAVARKRELEVTVVEALDRLCSRVAPSIISQYLHDLHERNGVRFHYRASAEDFESDIVVAGVGIVPNVEIAADAGLRVSNGIVVDEFGRTSDASIFAAGDVANLNGRRVESWANAQNQAIATAKTAAGEATAYRDIPWFWSTQYDVNMQFLGDYDQSAKVVMRGDPSTNRLTAFFLDGGYLLRGVIAVNSARDIRLSRKLMEQMVPVDPRKLSDGSIPVGEACLG